MIVCTNILIQSLELELEGWGWGGWGWVRRRSVQMVFDRDFGSS